MSDHEEDGVIMGDACPEEAIPLVLFNDEKKSKFPFFII